MTPAHRTELEELYEKLAVAEKALEDLDKRLTAPFAEYVPEIPECWAVIRQALSLIRSKRGGEGGT